MASILLDSCVWGGALRVLSDLGHDVIWSGSWAKDPGDVAILAAAHSELRILVSCGAGLPLNRSSFSGDMQASAKQPFHLAEFSPMR